MSRATRIQCEICRRKFWAARRDTLYCSERCRTRMRRENANFEVPRIPRSGVEGVTFSRVRRRWEARIRLAPGDWKYIGSFPSAGAAIRKKTEVEL
jgi:hypothetical protein